MPHNIEDSGKEPAAGAALVRLPGSGYFNPIWHRGFRIWACKDGWDRLVYAWAHDAADMDDQMDRRHGEAGSLHQARADIDGYLNGALRSLYEAVECVTMPDGFGGMNP